GIPEIASATSAPSTSAPSTTRVLDSMRNRRPTSPRDQRAAARLAAVLTLLPPTLNFHATAGGGGAGLSAMRPAGVPQLGFEVDGAHYFDYHHTPADTLDKVDPKQLRECVAALAATLYVVADMPGKLAD